MVTAGWMPEPYADLLDWVLEQTGVYGPAIGDLIEHLITSSPRRT